MNHFFKHFHLGRRANYPMVFLVGVFLLYVAGYGLFSSGDNKAFWQPKSFFELLAAVVGAAAAFVYFLYNQYHQDMQMFCSLFEKFNTRYNELNEKLNAIIARPAGLPLDSDQVNILYDYFNLCAEEYLFYDAGYIDVKVWQAWLHGMHYFAKDNAIRELWELEIKSGSYYGFKLTMLECVSEGLV